MNNKNIGHIVVVVISVLLLSSLFVILNVSSVEKKKGEKTFATTKLKTVKTPEVFGDKIIDREDDYLIVEEEKTEIKLKTFEAVVGYSVDYIYEEYSPVKVNNTKLVLINNDEHNIFIQIEVLDEDNYYDEYEDSLKGVYNHEGELEGYFYEYKFFRGNGVYLKITKSIDVNAVDSLNSKKLNYMINSLTINKR